MFSSRAWLLQWENSAAEIKAGSEGIALCEEGRRVRRSVITLMSAWVHSVPQWLIFLASGCSLGVRYGFEW